MHTTRTSVLRIGGWTTAAAAVVITASCDQEPLGLDTRPTEVAQSAEGRARTVRVMESADMGLSNPAGLAFSPGSQHLLLATRAPGVAPGRSTEFELITLAEERAGAIRVGATLPDPVNTTFDARTDRLLILQSPDDVLVEIGSRPDGSLDPEAVREIDVRTFRLEDPQGLTVDPATGILYVLDAGGPRLVRVEPHPQLGFERPAIVRIELAQMGSAGLRGIALDPTDGHLHVLDPVARVLHELTDSGRTVAVRDLSEVVLRNPQGMTFGSSGDSTDDPSAVSLYIADAGLGGGGALTGRRSIVETGHVTELSLSEPARVASGGAGHEVATLERATDMSRFGPPSPDPAGVVYLSGSGQLLVSDSEVNEMKIWDDANLFQTTLSGSLVATFKTTSYSDEPTGVTYNPSNGHLFISDDTGTRSIYEVDPGPDGIIETSDDVVTSFSTESFGSNDPEGVTYDTSQGVLFVVDGVNREVYRVSPGPNGLFDGADDDVTHFDTGKHGLDDPEGIAYNSVGNLFIIGQPETTLFEMTTGGQLVRTIDISAANPDKPAGLAVAPSSANPGQTSVYLVARGKDNGNDPNENDGMMYELSFSMSGDALPVVEITAPPNGSTYTEGQSIAFSGGATDTEDGDLTSSLQWISSLDGNIGAGGSFSAALSVGEHSITASVTDSGGNESMQSRSVTVNPEGVVSFEVGVALDSDDGEEAADGAVSLGSSDLELVDESTNQTVGVRFNSVAVPQGATITNATVQFMVDEADAGAANLLIRGQAVDHAPTFGTDSHDVSSRTTTTSSVGWSPPPWSTVGEAGPDQQTPNIASVIQEIVNRPGWSSGNSLVIIITGSGTRTADSHDGNPGGAALLHIDYDTGAPQNAVPVASDVGISGTPEVGETLTGSYTFADPDGDAEGTSAYQWLRDGAPISGATVTTYTLEAEDDAALIAFRVTPVAATGASPGVAATSAAVGPVGSPNSAPTASNVTITGTPYVGEEVTGSYTYGDAEGDSEGGSTYRWLRGSTPIPGATATTYTLVSADQGAMIVFEVTPTAQSGTSPGAPVQSPPVGPVNDVPVASNVSVTGTAQVGSMLTGSHTYADPDGDPEGTPTYRWLRDGVPITDATASTYVLVSADQGAMIVFEVTPVAQSGASPGTPAPSSAVGPVASATNGAPTATNVTIAGTPQVGASLTGSYTYADADGDLEGTSTYRWLRDGVAIADATAPNYTLVPADQGALISFEVTPVAQSGTSPGLPAVSAPVGPVAPTVSVTMVDPGTVPKGSSLDVTITGANFAPGATVGFDTGQGPAPTVSNVVWLDESTITATFTTKSGGPNRNLMWDVRVTNPGGSAGVLVGGLIVTP